MLPDLIEIIPLRESVRAQVTVPGSKSITNRALILAALARGKVILRGALWSEDTQVMVDCLGRLGFAIGVSEDPAEECNRTLSITGLGGRIPRGGSGDAPLDLFVGNAGTAARFLSALVCLGDGVYRLHGVPRMHERPQGALFAALRELGFLVEAEGRPDKLPVRIEGRGSQSHGRTASVQIGESSQFASALLLSAHAGEWKIEVDGHNPEESPYVAMTLELIKTFPHAGGEFQIEPDASSGSYIWAAGSLPEQNAITVSHWPVSNWQFDQHFPEVMGRLLRGQGAAVVSRDRDLGDSIMTAITLAPLCGREVRFEDLGRLRVQECERVMALRTELTRCGARAVEKGDTLEISPSVLHGAEIQTYDDHRMAMCFAVLGLAIPGIRLQNPGCVKKTFPNFFQKLCAAPPLGLNAKVVDPETRKPLTGRALFAD